MSRWAVRTEFPVVGEDIDEGGQPQTFDSWARAVFEAYLEQSDALRSIRGIVAFWREVPTNVTATSVTLGIPPGAASGTITILNPAGAATSPGTFTVTP